MFSIPSMPFSIFYLNFGITRYVYKLVDNQSCIYQFKLSMAEIVLDELIHLFKIKTQDTWYLQLTLYNWC